MFESVCVCMLVHLCGRHGQKWPLCLLNIKQSFADRGAFLRYRQRGPQVSKTNLLDLGAYPFVRGVEGRSLIGLNDRFLGQK